MMNRVSFKFYFLATAVISLADGQARGAVRLSRNGASSPTYYYGQLQIYWDNDWNNICNDNSFSTNEGEVACHQLGYTGLNYISSTNYRDNGGSTVLSNVHCSTSDFLVLLQCTYNVSTSANCTNTVALHCTSTNIWSSPYSGMVRLQDGDYSSEGRVEVYCGGSWGTVCDDTFDDTDANTVCKQLGYTGASSWSSGELSGTFSQAIWFGYVHCNEGDRCVSQCQRCPVTSSNMCTHSEDVSVVCSVSVNESLLSTTQLTCVEANTTSSTTEDTTSSKGSVFGGILPVVGAVILTLFCASACIMVRHLYRRNAWRGMRLRGVKTTTVAVVGQNRQAPPSHALRHYPTQDQLPPYGPLPTMPGTSSSGTAPSSGSTPYPQELVSDTHFGPTPYPMPPRYSPPPPYPT